MEIVILLCVVVINIYSFFSTEVTRSKRRDYIQIERYDKDLFHNEVNDYISRTKRNMTNPAVHIPISSTSSPWESSLRERINPSPRPFEKVLDEKGSEVNWSNPITSLVDIHTITSFSKNFSPPPSPPTQSSLCGTITNPCLLVLCLTPYGVADKYNPWDIVLHIMSLFQQHFSFRSVVFTNDTTILSFAHSLNLLTHSTSVNDFKLPFFKDMMVVTQSLIHSHFVGYINSDIGVDPLIFELLEWVLNLKLKHVFGGDILLASTVYVRKSVNVTTTSTQQYFRSLTQRLIGMRHVASADVFIYSTNSSLDYLSNTVVGRRGIDSIALSFSYMTSGYLIDITHAVHNVHLGTNSHYWRTRNQRLDNSNWNIRVAKLNGIPWHRLSVADYSIEVKGNEWRLIQRNFTHPLGKWLTRP